MSKSRAIKPPMPEMVGSEYGPPAPVPKDRPYSSDGLRRGDDVLDSAAPVPKDRPYSSDGLRRGDDVLDSAVKAVGAGYLFGFWGQ